jgi:hypothetical protein
LFYSKAPLSHFENNNIFASGCVEVVCSKPLSSPKQSEKLDKAKQNKNN